MKQGTSIILLLLLLIPLLILFPLAVVALGKEEWIVFIVLAPMNAVLIWLVYRLFRARRKSDRDNSTTESKPLREPVFTQGKTPTLLGVVFLIAFVAWLLNDDSEEEFNQQTTSVPTVQNKTPPKKEERIDNELNYFAGVTVSDILKVINKNGLTLYEKNDPQKLDLNDGIILNNFFSNYYKLRDGTFEITMSVTGLGDNLGAVEVLIQDFHLSPNMKRVQRVFDKIVSNLPETLFKGKMRQKNFKKVLSPAQTMDGVYRGVIDGIEYTYAETHLGRSLDIAKEGN